MATHRPSNRLCQVMSRVFQKLRIMINMFLDSQKLYVLPCAREWVCQRRAPSSIVCDRHSKMPTKTSEAHAFVGWL